jgi:nicotinamidase/pyrazinamidase
MSQLIFWDVDTQYDFMHPDGKLYVPGAEALVPSLKKLNEHAHARGIRIIASADDHVMEHEEISEDPDFELTYPPHCMRGTRGQQKIPETALIDPLVIEPVAEDVAQLERRVERHGGDILFMKHRFDVFTNPNVEPVLRVIDPDEIVVYGVALDVCNRYAVEGLLARCPDTQIHLVTDATKPIVATKAEALLADWSCRGVKLITVDDALHLGGHAEGARERTAR